MSGGVNKIWAAFRRWPVKTQVITGVVAGLLMIGAIGSATSGGTKASSVSALGSSETTSTTSKPERTTSTSTSTTVASTTTTEAPTTTEPPTTAPPTTKAAAPAPNCTPGYDPCIPPGSDVDCSGGKGNGPRYVDGPVYVTGPDVYDLDRDGNGVGCQ